MSIEVLGISGSPVKNSNTDRIVKSMLSATGVETEFIKLSDINIRPCVGCKKCVPDNICKVNDDFPELAKKIKSAKGLIIGAYTPYSQIDAFTKSLLERFWSMRHVNNLLRGKLCATVLSTLMPEMMGSVNQSMESELAGYERMELLGQLTVQGTVPCISCGEGDDCEMSGLKMLYGPDAKAKDQQYSRVEEQNEVWDEAKLIGKLMGERIKEL